MNQAAAPQSAFPHVTVATIVHRDGRYLMVEEEVNDRIVYNQPAGHLDIGESLLAAAVRETREETGWQVQLDHLVAIHQWHSHEHGDEVLRFSFAATALEHDARMPLDAGIQRCLWLSRTEIEALGDALRSPMILLSIDAWLTGQRLPLQSIDCLLPRAAP
ncbi:NUDIX hydrolase [Frateuria aurantia]|uniref:Phosphatase NudJ n=1 Tax=Frateuria aurantia (strain ATCC 33424 / DSM 6220 / KCTC 2777 / LMG 1558 / NBRC 3245 / NCIMB 13370) TaxID=767434 RepID=H8L4H0_FRAAD|nr:ADP-ribose pyrophosphatase [Frateuria aurantia DSM 6220]